MQLPEMPSRAAPQCDAERVPAVWQVGDVILDLYEVKHIYHSGGMGLVYRVYHKDWNLDLAVKSPRPESFKSERQKENFERECETWIDLGLHPHIVSCYYVRRLGGIPRVFAEYVEGGSLKDWIDDRRLYEGGHEEALKRILDIAIQFAWGLQYAHDKGLVHQDVKPGNVMMTSDGTAKVTDFGLARAGKVTDEQNSDDSTSGVLVTRKGMTPAYCSPEQANGDKLSPATDLWSWAVSVLEMFTGEVTWPTGQVAGEALENHLEMGAEDEHLPPMPDGLAALLNACLRPSPSDRPESPQTVAVELKGIYAEATGGQLERQEPKPIELQADALNNKALSYLDIEQSEQAEALWEMALAADPFHLESRYNRGLRHWRNGRGDDLALTRQLEEVQTATSESRQAAYLLGLVHIERADGKSAIRALTDACSNAESDTPARRALRIATDCKDEWAGCVRTLDGHKDFVSSARFSPDGRLVASGGGDQKLKLWESSTGKCLREIHDASLWLTSVNTIDFSPDGRFILSGSRDETLKLWDVTTGACVRECKRLALDRTRVQCVRYMPDGERALSASQDHALTLWDFSTGKSVRRLVGHASWVTSVSVSLDGRFAISGSWDGTLKLWDPSTGKCIKTCEGAGRVNSVAFSRDGCLALSGNDDKELKLWSMATGECLRTFEAHIGKVLCVSLSPIGGFALSGSSDKTVKLWNISTGRCLRTFEAHQDGISAVQISPDGRWGLSGSLDHTLRLWDLRALQTDLPQRRAEWRISRSTVAEKASEGSRKHRSALHDGSVALETGRIHDALGAVKVARAVPGFRRSVEVLAINSRIGESCRRSLFLGGWLSRTLEGHNGAVEAVDFSLDGRFAASGGKDKAVRIWEAATGECVQTLDGHKGGIKSLSLAPDGRTVLTGSDDNTLRIWDILSGKCLQEFQQRIPSVTVVRISPDGRLALSSGQVELKHKVQIWDIATGNSVRTFAEHKYRVNAAEFSPDGRYVVSGSDDGTVKIWDASMEECLYTLQWIEGQVKCVSLLPGGRLALIGGGRRRSKYCHENWAVEFWDITTGTRLGSLEGPLEGVRAVSVSPDGRFALTGADGSMIRLWRVATGECLRTFEGHVDGVRTVSFSRDGRFALSGGGDGTVRLWELDWEYEFPGWSDWDEGARPHLDIFLTLRCPLGIDGVSRVGKPSWDDHDFQDLLADLKVRGYGWLRPEGVRKILEEMTAHWTGPPPLLAEGNRA